MDHKEPPSVAHEVTEDSVVRALDDNDCYRSAGSDAVGVDRAIEKMAIFSAAADHHSIFPQPPEPPLGIFNPNCHVEVSSEISYEYIGKGCRNSLEMMNVDYLGESEYRYICLAYPRYCSISFEVNVYQVDKKVIVEVQRQAGDGCEFHRIYRQFVNNLHQLKITNVVFQNPPTCPPLPLGKEVNLAGISPVVARDVETLKSRFAESVDEALVHLAQLSREEIYHDILLQQKDLVDVLLRCCSLPQDDLTRVALACLGNLANANGVTNQIVAKGGVPIIVQKCHSTVLQVQRESGSLLYKMLSHKKGGPLAAPEVRSAAETLIGSTDSRIRDWGDRILISLGSNKV